MSLINYLIFLISILTTLNQNCGHPATLEVSELILKLPDDLGLVKYFKELELKKFCDTKLLEITEIEDFEKTTPEICLCSVIYYLINDSIKEKVNVSDVEKAKDDIKANGEEFFYNAWKEVAKISKSLDLFMKPLDKLDKWRRIYYNINDEVRVHCIMVNLEVMSLYNVLKKSYKDQKKNIDTKISLPEQSESLKKIKIKSEDKTTSLKLEIHDDVKKKEDVIVPQPNIVTKKNNTNILQPKLTEKTENTDIQPQKAISKKVDTDIQLSDSVDKKEEDYVSQSDINNKDEYLGNSELISNTDQIKENEIGEEPPIKEKTPTQEPVKENPDSLKKSLMPSDDNHLTYTNDDDIENSDYPIDKEINTIKKKQLVIIPKKKFVVDDFSDSKDSRFLLYFTIFTVFTMIFYLVLYNKKKIVALLIEGRRSNNSHRRRPNIAGYSKVETEDGSTVF